jgi:broad specificity phosphatase PhoE
MLIRHAAIETGSRLCGALDVPLSPAGRAALQALVRGTRHADVPDALFTSTLKRALDVAEALGRAWGRAPQSVDWAREIDCGDLEGIPLDRVRREFPDLWARNEAQSDDGFAWPGGETYAQFRKRVLDGLDRAAAAHRGCRIVIVTHAGVISQVLGVLEGRAACVWEPDRPEPLTATEVLWEDGAPREVLTFNNRDWF